jgi:hypothetical protein
MLYAVASVDWAPGHPFTPSGGVGGLYRRRAEADARSGGLPTLALALRYDPGRGVVVPQGQAARDRVGLWAVPAVVGAGGAVTVLGPIPKELVREVGPSELRAHPGVVRLLRRPHFLWGRSAARS